MFDALSIASLVASLASVWVIVWIVLFFWLAVFALGVYVAHKKGYLRWWHYVLFCIPIVVFLVADLLSNLTLAWFIFKDRPRELLVTQRLSRYRETLSPSHRNHKIAVWVCELNLNIFDPGHC